MADLGIGGLSEVQSLRFNDVDGDGRDDLTLGIDVTHDVVHSADAIAVLHGHDDGVHPAVLAAPGQPGSDSIRWSRKADGHGHALGTPQA